MKHFERVQIIITIICDLFHNDLIKVELLVPFFQKWGSKIQTMKMTDLQLVCHQGKLFIPWNKTVFCRDLLCVNRCIWKPIWPKWLFLSIPLPASKCLWYITAQLKAIRQFAWFERRKFIYWHYTGKLKKEAFFFKKNISRNLK